MNPDGSDVSRLTTNYSLEQFVAWSPGGTKIVFDTWREANIDVYVMNANGGSQARLTDHGALDAFPDWQPLVAGDVNCGGGVNSVDAALVLQLEAGLLGSLICRQNADVNGDGRTDSLDALLILQYSAGLIDSLPA